MDEVEDICTESEVLIEIIELFQDGSVHNSHPTFGLQRIYLGNEVIGHVIWLHVRRDIDANDLRCVSSAAAEEDERLTVQFGSLSATSTAHEPAP